LLTHVQYRNLILCVWQDYHVTRPLAAKRYCTYLHTPDISYKDYIILRLNLCCQRSFCLEQFTGWTTSWRDVSGRIQEAREDVSVSVTAGVAVQQSEIEEHPQRQRKQKRVTASMGVNSRGEVGPIRVLQGSHVWLANPRQKLMLLVYPAW